MQTLAYSIYIVFYNVRLVIKSFLAILMNLKTKSPLNKKKSLIGPAAENVFLLLRSQRGFGFSYL